MVFCRDQNLSEEQLATPGVGTFGGIVATLRHIITADGSHVRRLADSDLAWVDSDEDADFQKLEVWAEEARQLWEQVLSPIDVERVVIVDNGIREVHAGIFVAQALNHANHHREQVCAILTGFGVEPRTSRPGSTPGPPAESGIEPPPTYRPSAPRLQTCRSKKDRR